MNNEKLLTAIDEARRFLMRAESLQKEHFSDYGTYWASAKTAAVRRASMDLTRALADLRKPE